MIKDVLKENIKTTNRTERLRQATRQRRENDKLELRQIILSEASKLFLQYGYERFSLRQVAEEIGYSPGTIYLYFKDKDDLLFNICQEGFERLGQVILVAAGGDAGPRERLARVARAYAEFGLHYPVYYRLMFMYRPDFLVQEAPHHSEPAIDSFKVLQEVVQQAMEAGELKPGDSLAVSNTIWGLMHGIISLAIILPDNINSKEVQNSIELAIDIIKNGLSLD